MWSPEQYLKFRDERTQPSRDLAARIAAEQPASILDVGCGPGNSTAVLRMRWPDAEITGVDNSAEMIGKAREDYPRGTWVVEDASKLGGGPAYDIVFSNAALQWIPDHGALIPRLFALVKRKGAFAVQVPDNRRSALHRALLSVAGAPDWRPFTAGCENLFHYHGPLYYYRLLQPLAATIDLWVTAYYHVLSSQEELIEWYRGSGMRPFLDRLPDEARKSEFAHDVLEACRRFYPVQKGGAVLYPFRRVFFIAYAR